MEKVGYLFLVGRINMEGYLIPGKVHALDFFDVAIYDRISEKQCTNYILNPPAVHIFW